MAANLKVGDIFEGQRINLVTKYTRRDRSTKPDPHKLAKVGVLVLTPNKSGNDIDVFKFPGLSTVKVKRPGYNMQKRAKGYRGN